MRIAIASGKGGTGKTTLAVNLARAFQGPVTYVDCDVEEPNGHIFLKPVLEASESVGVRVPSVDAAKCTACGECSRMCQYHALVSLKTKTLVFPELCHGCGGCALVCPAGAITYVKHEIGLLETGMSGTIRFVQGRLNVGQAMSPPLIRAVKRTVAGDKDGVVLIDAPPGTSCPVVTAIKDCDYVLLVTEPTPFGLHDLELAVATVRQLGLPFGVVINRADVGDARVAAFCEREDIEVLTAIADDRRIAEAYSRGTPILDALPGYRPVFKDLCSRILDVIKTRPSAAEDEV